MKRTAAYVRVSTRQQNGDMQVKALKEWADAKGLKLTIYRDTFTGKTMDRPGWAKLEKAIRAGRVGTLVIWKLDRLGRTVKGLSSLFAELLDRGVKLISLTEGFDLTTTTGKLVANIMASIAEFETELRGERVAAGQDAARAKGKTWGGSRKGWTPLAQEKLDEIRRMHAEGRSKAAIARITGLSWPTVHKYCEA